MASIWRGCEVEAPFVEGSTCSVVSAEEDEPKTGLRGRDAGSVVSQAFCINRKINANQ
jgi:hypothetical protein